MTQEEFNDRMTALTELDEGGDWEGVYDVAMDLKEDILSDEETDPMQLGWARFYQFKALYALQDYEEAFELLGQPEPEAFVITQSNAAWMCSVGAELAMRADDVEGIVEFGRRALDYRKGDGDVAGAMTAANTVCDLLGEVDHPELNVDFALFLTRKGVENRWGDAVVDGMRHLIRSAAASGSKSTASWVALFRPELEEIAEAGAAEAEGLLEQMEEADWYRRYLVSLDDAEALWEAADEGDVEGVAARLEEGMSPDTLYPERPGLPTPLMAAAFNGHREVVSILLDAGATIELPNTQGRTALIHAADQGHAPVVHTLLEYGANPNARDVFEQTALHVAAWQDHVDCVDALIRHDPELEARDATGRTPLSLAATEDVPDVVRLLIEAGADPNSRNDGDQTPVMGAAMYGHREVARALLEAGADLDFEDEHGMSARDWAEQEGQDEILELFDNAPI